MKSKVINGVVIVSMITLLAVLAFFVRIGATADSVAVLKTSGMTCSSCSSRITTVLQSLPGVAVTEVDVEGGLVVVGYETKRLKPASLADKVSGAGFGCNLQVVLTPEQFKQMTGRDIGGKAPLGQGCGGCGSGGCGSRKKS